MITSKINHEPHYQFFKEHRKMHLAGTLQCGACRFKSAAPGSIIYPAAEVERYKQKAAEIRFLTLPQIDQQLKALEDHPQMRPMVAMLIYAGLRREELLWLQHHDIDLDSGPYGNAANPGQNGTGAILAAQDQEKPGGSDQFQFEVVISI